MSKIFEVGISESLREHVKHFNLDIVEEVNKLVRSTEIFVSYMLSEFMQFNDDFFSFL